MKKIVRIIICIVFISPLIIGTQSFTSPEPVPAPEETIYRILNGDDYKIAVYQIAHGGYCCFNEGPYFPTSDEQNYESQWLITDYSATYARVWEWDGVEEEWDFYGDIDMDEYNTTPSYPDKIARFVIDVNEIINPD